MPPTTSYRRGDVVLVPFPFTDLTGAKQRPAVVVSPDANNVNRPDVVIVAITSQMPSALASDEIAVPPGDLAACGLLKPSIVKAAKLVTIHQDLIRKRIGLMPRAALERVLEAVRKQFEQ
ncbi:MAG TPA: type II toxin-antitoxin system PemK/MazF family toxin [Candidatus Binataceae bacterium]|nr:type II toxin-antitoxin system PemK/MazF family toxin [Candidatus Binataceae bacterium]